MGREGHGDSGRAGQLWRAAQRLPSACSQQGTLKTPWSPCSHLPSLVLIQSWSLGVALSTAYPVCFFLSLLVLNLNVALSLWAWTASCQAAWWSGWDNDLLIPAPMLSPKYTHFPGVPWARPHDNSKQKRSCPLSAPVNLPPLALGAAGRGSSRLYLSPISNQTAGPGHSFFYPRPSNNHPQWSGGPTPDPTSQS